MSEVAVSYTLSTTTRHPFDAAVSRVREALADEGFGVLCEIDVQQTLKQKLGIDREPYLILGIAVLLDAALIRLLLLPVLLRLMGRWAWYLPRWLDRALPNVTFGHA